MLTPDQSIRSLADFYCKNIGLPAPERGHYVSVSPQLAACIAREYDTLPVHDARPLVDLAYRRLAGEVYQQFAFIERHGYRLNPWTEPGQPYADSAAMRADLRDNYRLSFFLGGEDHPYLARLTYWHERSGTDLTGNDMLRAVHDVFGHAAEGYGFGARGEENAWIHHSMMFSPLAQLALTTETRGQNSWVNFGPHAALPVTDRPYAVQKSALMPRWVTNWRAALGG